MGIRCIALCMMVLVSCSHYSEQREIMLISDEVSGNSTECIDEQARTLVYYLRSLYASSSVIDPIGSDLVFAKDGAMITRQANRSLISVKLRDVVYELARNGKGEIVICCNDECYRIPPQQKASEIVVALRAYCSTRKSD